MDAAIRTTFRWNRPLWTRCTPLRAWSSPWSSEHARVRSPARCPSEARGSWEGTTHQSSGPSADGSTGSAWTLRGRDWGVEEDREKRWERCELWNEVKRDEVTAEAYICLKCTDVLTDVTFFALFCFVAQADFKSVDFTWQVTETTDKYIC